MFKKTTGENIQKILDENELQYFDEREELDDLLFDDETSYYQSDDMLLIVSPGTNLDIWAIPLTDDFDLAAFEKWLEKQGGEYTVHMNVTGMNPGSFRYQEYYEVSEPIKSFYHAAESDLDVQAVFNGEELGSKIPGTIRKLTSRDEKIAKDFPQTQTRGVMDLGQIFSFVIHDDLGGILGYFDEDNRLIAYLTYMPANFDVYAVDDVYVLPSKRNQGVGTSLSKVVVAIAADDEQATYWPVAETELAQKTARAAGFTEVASRITIQNL